MSENTGIHRLPVENERTRVHSLSHLLPAPRLLDAHEAFIVAYDRLSGLSRIARAPAVLVAAVDARAHVVAAVIVEAGQSLVIGRHTHCGIRLEKDTIALRHLVAHASAGAPEAAPATRLWELNTGQPFLTEDGQPNAAVIAQGPLYAAVDQYALLFVPTQGPSGPPWPTSAEEAWKALPPREFIDRRTPRQPPHAPGLQVRRPDGQAYETNISSVRQQYDRSSISRVSPLWLLGDEDSGDAFAELVLQHGREVATHRISIARLEQGVLLGLYERCGVPLPKLYGLSRVHLLLVQEGDEVLAIDTASTNGTWRGPKEIRTSTLRNPDSLVLAGSMSVHWRRL